MTIKATLAMSLLLMCGVAGRTATGTVADLPPQLRESLLHDVSCDKSADAESQLLQSQVVTQEIRSAAGSSAGVIAVPQGGCNCTSSACRTYVYLNDGQAYRLAFAGEFTTLHLMRGFKRGMPSLTGKLQVSDTQAETTVYDWNGRDYEPSLCATVTQARNQRLPSIVRHECGKGR
jgi:hypothetical protein